MQAGEQDNSSTLRRSSRHRRRNINIGGALALTISQAQEERLQDMEEPVVDGLSMR